MFPQVCLSGCTKDLEDDLTDVEIKMIHSKDYIVKFKAVEIYEKLKYKIYSWQNKENQLKYNRCAGVAKSADARDLKSLGSNTVPVQVRSPAPWLDGQNLICRRDGIGRRAGLKIQW